MSVLRFEPYRDPFRELDRLIAMAASGTRAPLGMPMDVYRVQDGSYHLEADLPGVDPDSVEVTVEHSTLTIRAERTQHYGESEQVIVAERPQGSFTRQLSSARAGLGEPHRRLRRRCPARDHSCLTEGPGPPGRDHPSGRAAAPSRGAPSSRTRRRPTTRAVAQAERRRAPLTGRASRGRCGSERARISTGQPVLCGHPDLPEVT